MLSKTASCFEPPADAAIIRVFTDAILGTATQDPDISRFQPPGWPGVLEMTPTVIRHLHYGSDADALVVAADANETPIHAMPDAPGCGFLSKCRLCRLRREISQTTATLAERTARDPLKIAVALPVPTIEAWCLAGQNPNVSENAWRIGMQQGALPYTKLQLKQWVYGTQRPSLELETEKGTAAARTVAENIDALEQLFPVGFGGFAEALRNWQSGR